MSYPGAYYTVGPYLIATAQLNLTSFVSTFSALAFGRKKPCRLATAYRCLVIFFLPFFPLYFQGDGEGNFCEDRMEGWTARMLVHLRAVTVT